MGHRPLRKTAGWMETFSEPKRKDPFSSKYIYNCHYHNMLIILSKVNASLLLSNQVSQGRGASSVGFGVVILEVEPRELSVPGRWSIAELHLCWEQSAIPHPKIPTFPSQAQWRERVLITGRKGGATFCRSDA